MGMFPATPKDMECDQCPECYAHPEEGPASTPMHAGPSFAAQGT